MNGVRKNLIASALVILFALGVLCASLSTPASALASQMPDCSTPGSVLDNPCQPLLCNLAGSHNLLSQGAIASARFYDPAKDGSFLLGEVVPPLAHNGTLLAVKQLRAIWSGYFSEKVPVHLFNSVLTL